MDTHDRAFLHDIVGFTSMNRVATVYTLLKGLSDLEDVAKFTVGKIWNFEPSAADVSQNGDTGRIQRILVAKIYTELMNAYEDLGSFCDAIKNRQSQKRPGIFRRCLSGDTRQAAQFLDEVFKRDISNHPEETLDVLLSLPSVQEITGTIQPEMLSSLEEAYREIAKNLYDVAAQYRAKRSQVTTLDTSNVSLSDSKNDVNIFMGIVLPGDNPKESGVQVDAFNKTKHQFLLPEDLSKYIDPTIPYKIEFGRFSQSPQFVTLLIQNTIAVAHIMRTLANILLTLDEKGVPL